MSLDRLFQIIPNYHHDGYSAVIMLNSVRLSLNLAGDLARTCY